MHCVGSLSTMCAFGSSAPARYLPHAADFPSISLDVQPIIQRHDWLLQIIDYLVCHGSALCDGGDYRLVQKDLQTASESSPLQKRRRKGHTAPINTIPNHTFNDPAHDKT
ncbi:hypothetical protein IWX90DRAFT_416075 [Phyllosticta citrichinensis]|uniref:Uncharacterized protein n=1 Tax=Phyllosticta citrichinensis TaxID=1130410 RepID=A0ABR1XRH0_9PEZI